MSVRFVAPVVLCLWALTGCEVGEGDPSRVFEQVESTAQPIAGDGDATPVSSVSGSTTFKEVVPKPSGASTGQTTDATDHGDSHGADDSDHDADGHESPDEPELALEPEPEGEGERTLSDVELMARYAGVSASRLEAELSEAKEDEAEGPADDLWQPGDAIPGSWGVRLVRTLHDTHPPSAVIGLPDGSQHVVEAGTMLPDAGVVVLAIGRDAVQIAEITPMGDRARIDTSLLQPLYRTAPDVP